VVTEIGALRFIAAAWKQAAPDKGLVEISDERNGAT
jgi:hypothetical protein